MEVEDFIYKELDDLIKEDKCHLIILDHLEDPHNLGAIIRTSEAAGLDGIILPKNRSVSVNETVMKTSVGALYNVSICQVVNLNFIFIYIYISLYKYYQYTYSLFFNSSADKLYFPCLAH